MAVKINSGTLKISRSDAPALRIGEKCISKHVESVLDKVLSWCANLDCQPECKIDEKDVYIAIISIEQVIEDLRCSRKSIDGATMEICTCNRFPGSRKKSTVLNITIHGNSYLINAEHVTRRVKDGIRFVSGIPNAVIEDIKRNWR